MDGRGVGRLRNCYDGVPCLNVQTVRHGGALPLHGVAIKQHDPTSRRRTAPTPVLTAAADEDRQ